MTQADFRLPCWFATFRPVNWASKRAFALNLALILALGACGSSTIRISLGASAPAFEGIWPESSLAKARAVQPSPELRWRLDPRKTASHFATEVLGWRTTDGGFKVIGGSSTETEAAHTIRQCAGVPDCVDASPTETVGLKRLDVPSNFWSVTSVTTPKIQLGITPGAALSPGESFRLEVRVAPRSFVFDGLRYTCSFCSGASSGNNLDSEAATFYVDSLSGCRPSAGYVYVEVPETPSHPKIRDPFHSNGLVYALAAYPVTFPSAPSGCGPTSE